MRKDARYRYLNAWHTNSIQNISLLLFSLCFKFRPLPVRVDKLVVNKPCQWLK